MVETKHVPQLKNLYDETIKGDLTEEFQYSSSMQLPRLEKVVLSMGVGEAIQNKKLLDAAVSELSLIAGQKRTLTIQRSIITAS